MSDNDKIELANYIIRYLQDKATNEDLPKMVGHLNKSNGVVGFQKADIGHPVFEYKGRYILYLERNDGKLTIELPFFKETLKPAIDFINTK